MQQNTQNQPKFYVGQKVIISSDKHNPKANSYTVTELTHKTISVSYRGILRVHQYGPYNFDGSDCAGLQFIPDPRVEQEPPKEDKEEPQMFYPEPGDIIVCRNGKEYECCEHNAYDYLVQYGHHKIHAKMNSKNGFCTWKDHTGGAFYNNDYDIVKIIPKSKPIQQNSVQTEEPRVYSVRQVVEAVAELNPYLVKRDDYEQQIKALEVYLAKINDPDWKTYQELKQKFKE